MHRFAQAEDLAKQILSDVSGYLDEAFQRSICLLGEILHFHMYSVALAFREQGQESLASKDFLGSTWDLSYPMNAMRSRLLKLGWCPKEISQVHESCYGATTMHYLSLLKRAKPYRDHSFCDEKKCAILQQDQESYKTLHVNPDCQCSWFEADQQKLQNILEASDTAFPVLLLSFPEGDEQTWNVTIEAWDAKDEDPATQYVALSHVSICCPNSINSRNVDLGWRCGQTD